LTRRGFAKHPRIVLDCVTSAAAALEAAARTPYDVFLLDNRLPDMEGVRLCAELRRRGTRARLVFVTSVASETLAARAFAAGADGFVVKDGAYLDRLAEDILDLEAGR